MPRSRSSRKRLNGSRTPYREREQSKRSNDGGNDTLARIVSNLPIPQHQQDQLNDEQPGEIDTRDIQAVVPETEELDSNGSEAVLLITNNQVRY